MSRSNPEGAGPDPMETDELSLSQARTVTLQDTTIARSTDSGISPGLPPVLFQPAAMRLSKSQQSQTPAEPILTPVMSRRFDCINRSLHQYEDNLAQSIDQEHLAFQSLPPQIQHLVQQLRKVKRDIMTGARYIGRELEQIDSSMLHGEAGTIGLQDTLKRVSGRMDGHDNRQTRHEQVTS